MSSPEQFRATVDVAEANISVECVPDPGSGMCESFTGKGFMCTRMERYLVTFPRSAAENKRLCAQHAESAICRDDGRVVRDLLTDKPMNLGSDA